MSTITELQVRAAMRRAETKQMVASGRRSVHRTRVSIALSRALLDRPRLAFRGGADSQPDAAAVRRRVRELLDTGFLSRFSAGRLVAGPCRRIRDCAVCGGGIMVGEPEVEIASRTGSVVIYLHRACLDFWIEEASNGNEPP
jgi:hypothetical protein